MTTFLKVCGIRLGACAFMHQRWELADGVYIVYHVRSEMARELILHTRLGVLAVSCIRGMAASRQRDVYGVRTDEPTNRRTHGAIDYFYI